MRSQFVASLLAVGGFLSVTSVSGSAFALDYFAPQQAPVAQATAPAQAPATNMVAPTAFTQAAPAAPAPMVMAPQPTMAVAAPTCAAEAANCGCVTDCCDDARWWQIQAGASVTFLSASSIGGPNNNFVQIVNGPAATLTTVAQDDGRSGIDGAPRVWVGLTAPCGLGIRGTYWQFTQNTNQFDPSFPVVDLNGSGINSGLDLWAVDLEGTYTTCIGNWDLFGSFGVRHAEADTFSALSATELVDIGGGGGFDLVTGSAISGQSFNGTGLTFGLQGLRPLLSRNCGSLDFYGSARGSYLWGSSNAFAAANSLVANTGFAAIAGQAAVASTDEDDMFISEFQLGLQLTYDFDRPCCPTRAFVRTFVEYQNWSGGDNLGVGAATVAGRGGVNQVTSLATSNGVDGLELFGFGIATGINW